MAYLRNSDLPESGDTVTLVCAIAAVMIAALLGMIVFKLFWS